MEQAYHVVDLPMQSSIFPLLLWLRRIYFNGFEQLLLADGLRHIVIHPCAQALLSVALHRVGRQRDDRNVTATDYAEDLALRFVTQNTITRTFLLLADDSRDLISVEFLDQVSAPSHHLTKCERFHIPAFDNP